MAKIRLPLNILALTGKLPANPESTFNNIIAYQLRDSLNGLPEIAVIFNEANATQAKEIFAKVFLNHYLYFVHYFLHRLKPKI